MGDRQRISLWEGVKLLIWFSDVSDPFGYAAACLEWGFLWILCQQDGYVDRHAIEAQYDGTLFYEMAKKEC